MPSQPPRALGILGLERGLPPNTPMPNSPNPGSMLNPTTFDFPVIWETVENAWAESVICGDPTLEAAYVAAARRLVERGARAISSACGFSIRFQAAVSASVNVPVAMSSLLLLPLLLQQTASSAKIAVLTFDSTKLHQDLLGIDDPIQRARIVIGGIEGGQFWRDEMKRPPEWNGVGPIETDVAACVARLRAEHPNITTLLFECTAFPMVSAAIRRSTNLPVYDINSLCRMTFGSIL